MEDSIPVEVKLALELGASPPDFSPEEERAPEACRLRAADMPTLIDGQDDPAPPVGEGERAAGDTCPLKPAKEGDALKASAAVPPAEAGEVSEKSDDPSAETDLHCFTYSDVNLRDQNEDSFLTLRLATAVDGPDLILLAVADGMGGHACGELASHEALTRLSSALFEQLVQVAAINSENPVPPTVEQVEEALFAALVQADSHVKRIAEVNRWGVAGSTLVAAALYEGSAIIVNLGDSPLFHYRGEDEVLVQLTRDHTETGAMVRAGLLTPEAARHHEGKHRLEFFCGAGRLPRERPLLRVPLRPGDVLLLCSDGVSCGTPAAELAELIPTPGLPLPVMAERLLRAALDAGETDNQTLVLWRQPAATAA